MSKNAASIVKMDCPTATQIEAMVGIWNEACGADLAVSPGFVSYNLQAYADVEQTGWLAVADGRPVAFIQASCFHGPPRVATPEKGWINALAVRQAFQRRGLGSTLLAKAESWLAGHGCSRAQLGGNLRLFVPGLPVELRTDRFFHEHSFKMQAGSSDIWDVASNLADYHLSAVEAEGAIRPAQPGQEGALLSFLAREFPGRWHYEAAAFLEGGGRLSDFMLLWTATGVDGFCQLTFEDSARPIERFYPYQLPRPWGQLGAIGVAVAVRGRGFGAALMDAGLRRLHNNGVNGCVIDWTGIPEFYAKFGFERYRSYRQLIKVFGS